MKPLFSGGINNESSADINEFNVTKVYKKVRRMTDSNCSVPVVKKREYGFV